MGKYETRRLLSFIRQACQHYDMIHKGDKIAVGLSGGKDSTALLIALNEMRRFYPDSLRGDGHYRRYGLCRHGFFAPCGTLPRKRHRI